MSELLILRGLLFAAECFLASLLLPVLAFAVSALLRRRAALRHLVFTTMFGVLAVLPLVALLLPPRRIVSHVAAPVSMSAVDVVPMAAPVIAAPPSSLFMPENIVLLLLALWLAGLAWQTLRLCVGGLGLLRLRRRSAPFAVELETGCDVRLADGEHGPSTFGIFRPIVLLPRSAQAWSLARLDAVLRHEAAHVARRDTLSQFIARLVCAVFWPNPLLWLAARSLRRQAEIAADDAVLAGGMTPSLYAAELVSLAAESRGVTPGIAMAGPPLAQRVEAVLANNSSRKGVSKMDMAKTVTLGLTAALLLGVGRFDIAVAQDAPDVVRVGLVPAEAASVAQIKARIEAQAAAIKAKADAVTAKAKAKAAVETDPVKKAQDEADAAKVAAQSARVKAQADQAAAQYAEEARKHMALAFQLADEVRQKTQAIADRAHAQADQQRMQLAEVTPPGHADASASRSADSSVTIDGATFTGHVRLESGNPGEPLRITADSVVAALPEGNDTSRMRSVSRYSNNRDGFQIDIQVDPAVDAMNKPEVRNAIRDAVNTAMAEASRKITAAITEARAKAGLPPVAPMAMPPIPSVPPVPRVPPVLPAPG